MHMLNSNNYFTTEHDLAKSVLEMKREERDAAPNREATSPFNLHTKVFSSLPSKRGRLPSSHRDFEEKVNSTDKYQKHFRNSLEVSVEATLDETRIPCLKNMEIRNLTSPFNKLNAILLCVPPWESSTDFMRAAFLTMYSVFQSMAPALTFHPNSKDLRCKGSYTEGFSTCTFEAQAWNVESSSSLGEREYIVELRQRSQRGRRAFAALKRHVAVALKDEDFATTYANGCQIHCLKTIDDDLGELSMPGSLRNENTCPITLQEEDVADMAAILTERKYPQFGETLELLGRCSVGSEDNRDVLRANLKLEKAIHDELSTGYDPNTCHTALSLIQQGAIIPMDILPAVARCLQVHSGFKRSGYKGTRSRAIECRALRVMETLLSHEGPGNEVAALKMIEEELCQTLRSEVFRFIQDIRVRQSVKVY